MLDRLRVEDSNVGKSGGGRSGFEGLGLAVASLVLGIISIPFSVWFLLGGLYALIGLVLATIHLKRRYPLRAMAGWGLGLSIVGLLATGAAGTWYYSVYRTIRFAGDALGPSSYAEWIDVEAPDFTVTDLDGNEVILSQLKGKRVILSFWATWCPPCKKEIPNLNRLRNVYDSNDLIILGISSESEETVKAFSEKRKINYTLAIEKDLPSPYSDIDSIPTTFFIDRRGIIRDILEGYNDFKHLDNHVRLLDEIDPNTNIQELLEVH